MSKTVLARQCLFSRPRRLSTSSVQKTSTSPQRYNVAAPALTPDTNLKKFSDIPGPLALPMLRHSAHVLPRIGCFHHTVGLGLLEGLQQRYGDLVRLAKASRSRPVLYVFDPELMREVYESNMTEPPQWRQSPLTEQRKQTHTQCPMHSNETKAIWTAMRTLLQDEAFLRNYDKVFDDIAADFTRRLEDLRHAENALNEELQTEIHRWAIEIIGVMMLGIRLGCLDGAVHVPSEDNRRPEKTSMDDHIKDLCSLSKRSELELTPAERFVRSSLDIANENYLVRSEHTLKPESTTFNEALKTFDKHFILTDHFLVQALEKLNNEEFKPEQVLLEKLRPLERRILPLVADVFLAGVDPLAQSAVSTLHELSLQAARQQRAHDEAGWARAARGEGLPVSELPYVAACVREAARLAPATGGVVRRSHGELRLDGYLVPPGVDIVLAHGVSSKLEKQWGRAKSFIPERWHSDGWQPLNASRAHPFASMPFGQNCPASGIIGKMLSSLAVYESNMTEPPQWRQSPLTEQRKQTNTQCPMHSNETKAIWTAMRTLLQDEAFLRNYDKVFDDIAADFTRRLEDLRHAENALNEELQTEIHRWAIEIIGVMMLGIRLGCLDGAVHVPSEDNRRPEKTSMDDHIKDLCSLSKRSEQELTPAERFVRSSLDIANENYLVRSEHTLKPESTTFNEALKTFDKHFILTDHFLVQALEKLNNEEFKPEQVLLEKLRPLERRILPLVADVFLAGVDPLAQSAVSTLHELSLQAARQQRAHDEAGWARAARGEGLPVSELPYVAACVREAARLAPATGGVVRRSHGELRLDGYLVPPGVDIVLAHGVSSKLEKQWGRAKSFIPERWHSDGWQPLNASRAHPFASMPFGQNCPASGIIGKMLSSLAVRVLDKYRIEWHGPPPSITTAGVNKIQMPYYFVLQNAG